MKETRTTYSYLIEHMQEPSFNKVRNLACDFVQKLPAELIDELHDQLNRGVDILDSEPLMQMYFYAYGNMHAEKLNFAFNNLSQYIKSAETIDIIDYGCGQGLASMCYYDYVQENCPGQIVRSITLIEPSVEALSRAELLCSRFYPDATITAIQKPFDELSDDDIETKSDIPTLHLFSNILDVEAYDIVSFANKVKSACKGDNEVVIVSPMQNERRVSRLKDFVNVIDLNCYFEKFLDKQQLRKDKDWTCCAILCSSRNSEFAAIDIKEVYRKAQEFFEDVTLWHNKEYCKVLFDELRLCANNGDVECMNAMGLFYANGILDGRRIDDAFVWFKIAAGYGFPRAVRNLALMYAKGDGIEANIPLAIETINKIKGSDSSIYHLCLGEIKKKTGNHEEAFENFRNAAELGDALAKFFYGIYLINGEYCDKDIKLGVKNIKSSAKAGNSNACFLLARYYENGFIDGGVEQSNTQAVKYYKSAAKKNNLKAQKKLAKIYKSGLLGVSKNQKESFKWYLIAAERGDYESAFYVALSYAMGAGIALDYTEAIKWYQVAANHGSSSAMNNLAVCYEKGNGVEKNSEKAFSLYLKAAEAGNIMAANNVSRCYQEGKGTEKNLKQALFWKEKEVEGGNSKAQGTLAEWYFKGYGAERSYEKALYWFVISKLDKKNLVSTENLFDYINHQANEENALFQYLLAKCYDYGIFVQKERSLSRMWYEKSAANGSVDSLIKLQRIDSISTEATKEEKAAGVKDEYGVLYSHDWKKVLSCSYVHCKSYKIRKGTRIICDGAFENQNIERLTIPNSVVVIGDNPFVRDQSYHNSKIVIENKSPNYIVKEDALYTKDGYTMVAYWGKHKQFAVPEHVKYIANRCFSTSSNLETIIVPQGVQSIGRKAFEDCYSLKSLDLPKSVKFIGESAFYGCEALEEIWSLGSIGTIEPNTFEGCNLKYVHFPSCLTTIKDNAFNSNSDLRIVDLPDMLETIGNHAFAYCNNLERINLGESIRFIGDFCFYQCAIQEVRLPSSLTHLGTRPFDKVKNIITKHNGRYKAEKGMLINKDTRNLECYFGDSSSVILKGIKSISPFAFYKSKIVEVILPNDIILLPEYVFYNSLNLKKVKMPEGLETIEVGAFWGCEQLCHISIPYSVKELKDAIFWGCTSLESIEFKGLRANATESIMEYQDYQHFPIKYWPHEHLMGSFITELDTDKPDIDSFKCITIIVPKSSKDQYTFKPVYHLEWNRREMNRRFEIVEKND